MAAGSPGYRSPSSMAVRSGERIAASNMARRRSSFGLFGIFGRSYDLRQFDQSLRALDVHPALVPEAVKLTAVTLLKDHADDDQPTPQPYKAAAEIIGYCIIEAEGFGGATTDPRAPPVE